MRGDSSSGWKDHPACVVARAVCGRIPPVGGGFGTLRRSVAGGFFQWVDVFGRLGDSYCPDSSSDWRNWDVGIADYVRFARVLHIRRAMVGLLVCAFVAFGEKYESGFRAVL